MERHGTGEAFRAKLDDEDAGIFPDDNVSLLGKSPPTQMGGMRKSANGYAMNSIEEEMEATVEWKLKTMRG